MINAIAALSDNNVIGVDNKLPWHIPEDFARLKKLTTGSTLIMGRKTHESIGRLLPGRISIIVTRDADYKVEGDVPAGSQAIICHSVQEALSEAKKHDREVFIFGGGQIFEQAMPFTDRLYLTIVHKTIEGDAYFPDYSEFKKVIEKIDGESNGYKYTFLTLER